jgi:D-alanyl-lipoteichoic acid acyltransferase DltB (MBOAT superfamily)
VDVYNEKTKAEKHPGYFALYVSFFPQLLMGPIDRAVNFIPELKKKIYVDIDRVVSGFRLVVWGIFKKMVISDRLAIFVNEVFRDPEQQGINLIFGAYFYAFQIYCDFSGYSDIAIGISRILGFKSMNNFDFPYFSKSMTQFWNRWHISLSTWLRDYLFLPIAYAVMRPIKTPKLYRIKAETWGYVIGMFLTMFLGGLWHGARWTFVIWGMLHGIYLIVGYITKKTRKKWVKKTRLNKFPGLRYVISVFITFNLVSFAWIFFRAESFEKALFYIKHLRLGSTGKGTVYLLFNLILVSIFIILEILYKNREKLAFIQQVPMVLKVVCFAFFICFTIIFAVDTSNEFIYLQF